MTVLKLVNVVLTQQGATMTDADIVEWFVTEGDQVERGQELVEVDAAKATFPIPSPVSGKVKAIHKQVDENVLVGEVIATIEAEER